MNPAFEQSSESGPSVAVLEPIDTDATEVALRAEESRVSTITTPTDLKQLVEAYKGQANQFVPTDPLSVRRTAAFIDTCKAAMKHAEAQRKSLVDPLNKQVKDLNAIWQPIVEGFAAIVKIKDAQLSQHVYEEQQRIEREQQAAIAEANRKQAELDRKAEEARLAAAAAQESGNTIEAAKQEGKAQRLELQAAHVAPAVVQNETPRKIDLGGSTFSVKVPDSTWTLAGWDKEKSIKVMNCGKPDARIASLVGEFSKLPAGVQFILNHCDLNPVHLNKSWGQMEFPAPFAKGLKFGGSRSSGPRK